MSSQPLDTVQDAIDNHRIADRTPTEALDDAYTCAAHAHHEANLANDRHQYPQMVAAYLAAAATALQDAGQLIHYGRQLYANGAAEPDAADAVHMVCVMAGATESESPAPRTETLRIFRSKPAAHVYAEQLRSTLADELAAADKLGQHTPGAPFVYFSTTPLLP